MLLGNGNWLLKFSGLSTHSYLMHLLHPFLYRKKMMTNIFKILMKIISPPQTKVRYLIEKLK